MANIIKYTTQSLSATLAGLANGNHATSYTFGFTDATLVWGGSNQYKTGTALTYSANLPMYLTPSTKGGTVSSSTYTLQAYASFSSTGLKSNIAEQTVEIRQHAIPQITSVPKNALWVGESMQISYSFAYTPYNTATKFSASGCLFGTQSDNKYTVLADLSDKLTGNSSGTVKATAQDPVGYLAEPVQINTYSPVSNIVFGINSAYYNSASTQPSHQITVMKGADVFVLTYYTASYNSNELDPLSVAYNSYFSGISIVSDATRLTAYSYNDSERSTVVSESAKGSYTVNLKLSNNGVPDENRAGLHFYKINGTSTIKIQTTTGTPTTATSGQPNALTKLINFITISVATGFEINFSMKDGINPGDKTTVTFSGGVGTAKTVELVNSKNTTATVLATFADGAGKSLENGTFEAVIPSTVEDGTWYIKVTPENGEAQYKEIVVKHVTLTLS